MRSLGVVLLAGVLTGCDPPLSSERRQDLQDVQDIKGQVLCSINGMAFIYVDPNAVYPLNRARSADKLCARLIDPEKL